ncbi:Uncharacterised protein [Amycolatopsis camponoti]|uniref:Uncharacterized protein n=1 Tax=Amycolatopsis camponoti TaxID=2606593 RepID=A0A6I8LL04_9PSEU|nr:Uncharacterised protein [Amycolatopsis camponoti]
MRDQGRPVAEVPVERGRARFEALREAPHRQVLGTLLVDEFQRRAEDPVQRDGGTATGPPGGRGRRRRRGHTHEYDGRLTLAAITATLLPL